MFREGSGQRLVLETRAAASYDIHVKTLFPVVDGWQRIGVAAEPVVIPAHRTFDLEEQLPYFSSSVAMSAERLRSGS